MCRAGRVGRLSRGPQASPSQHLRATSKTPDQVNHEVMTSLCKVTIRPGLAGTVPIFSVIVIVIVISELLKRYSKTKRTRAPAYSRALRRIKGGFQRGGVKRSSSPISRIPGGDQYSSECVKSLLRRSQSPGTCRTWNIILLW